MTEKRWLTRNAPAAPFNRSTATSLAGAVRLTITCSASVVPTGAHPRLEIVEDFVMARIDHAGSVRMGLARPRWLRRPCKPGARRPEREHRTDSNEPASPRDC